MVTKNEGKVSSQPEVIWLHFAFCKLAPQCLSLQVWGMTWPHWSAFKQLTTKCSWHQLKSAWNQLIAWLWQWHIHSLAVNSMGCSAPHIIHLFLVLQTSACSPAWLQGSQSGHRKTSFSPKTFHSSLHDTLTDEHVADHLPTGQMQESLC